MTPRQADVAFVLEGIAGVRAVYATRGKAAARFDFAVDIEGVMAMAAAHYALLRVLSNAECERVRMLIGGVPAGIDHNIEPLTLDATTRDAARARVPPPAPRPPLPVSTPFMLPHDTFGSTDVLIVDDDPDTEATFRSAFGDELRYHVVNDLTEATDLVRTRRWRIIVCDSRRAFGTNAFLARLPVGDAQRVHLLTDRAGLADARWRLQGTERILGLPLNPWQLRMAFFRDAAPDASDKAPVQPPLEGVARKVIAPPVTAPIRVLLVGVVEGEFDIAFARAFPGAKVEFVAKSDVDSALEHAFAREVSVIICGESAAIGDRNIIDGIAREDPLAARKIIVAANARDLASVRDALITQFHRNRVVALPLDEVALRAAVLRSHPELATRGLTMGGAPNLTRPAFRRLAALVVDDDTSTQILFSSRMEIDDADVAHTTTSLGALGHAAARPIDVLFISAGMRTDGGEPLYRMLWRMSPELKPRTVLIVPADSAPPSARDTKLPRILERPATRDRIAHIINAFRAASPGG